MTTESKEKALPGYKSLAERQKEQTNVLWKILEEHRIGNYHLDKINNYKEEQKQGDIKYRNHDVRIKSQSTYLNVFGLLMAGVALAISIKVNGIESVIAVLMGMF